MAIAFDAVNTGTPHTTVNATSLTFPHQTSGANRILFVGVMTSSARTTNSVTYNGASLTNINRSAGSQTEALYYMVAPDTGSSYNVVITIDSSSFIYSGSSSYTGASQSSPIDANNTSATTTTSLTTTLTTTTDNCWAVLAARGQSSGDTNASTNSTERIAETGFAQFYDSGGAITPAGSFGMTTTQTSQLTTHAMAAFKPALDSFIPQIIMS